MALTAGMLLQVVLTGQPQLVPLTAALLHTVLLHDSAAMASLYRTGVFFFALVYCGSNLVELACLLQVIPLTLQALNSICCQSCRCLPEVGLYMFDLAQASAHACCAP